MIGQIIVTSIGIIALILGLWTIKEMQNNKKLHHEK
jgi:hypothetical protein